MARNKKGFRTPWAGISGWIDRSVRLLVENEYEEGVDAASPEVFVDLCVTREDVPDHQSYEGFDVGSSSHIEVPVQRFPYLGERYKRLGLVLPYGTVFSKLVSFRKEKDAAEAIREKVNFDLTSSIYNIGFCGDEGDYRYLFISILPHKSYLAVGERLRNILRGGGSVVRVYDRLVPLTHFVAENMSVDEPVLCVEQRDDYLTLWNVARAGSSVVPVNSRFFRIPGINPPRSIENHINTMKNEFLRIYKFMAPKKIFIVSNGGQMVAGVLSLEDLSSICAGATGGKVVEIKKSRNSSLEGSLLMERRV